MKYDVVQHIEKPERKVLDFLNYLEKETTLKFDIASLSGITECLDIDVKSKDVKNIPVKFHFVKVNFFALEIVLPFCECEYCNKIAYLQILISGEDQTDAAEFVKKQIHKAVPYMTVFLTKNQNHYI
jgi:hypothetical protein